MTGSVQSTTFTFDDPDGYHIFVRKWDVPEGTRAKAAVQVAHGAAEHSLRYERVAVFLAEAGYLVHANDHRGHYMTAGSLDKAGMAGPDGWHGILDDAHRLTEIIKHENPGLPIFLFGHSMGSLLAQQYIEHWGGELAGVVLSGTFGTLPNLDQTVAFLDSVPRDEPSAAFAAMFAGFNEPFKPARTGFEWLSRDEAEVQKYVDDPWCGFPFTNGLVADFMKGGREAWQPENEARVPLGLPIFVFSGDQDPAGGATQAVMPLIQRYQAHGIRDVSYKFYPGARHEILNELNRDEVQADLLAWLDGHLKH